MNQSEWLEADSVAQNQYLLSLGRDRELQLFLCACCRRVARILDDGMRERVSRMAEYFKPPSEISLRNVWEAFEESVDAAERCANGLITLDECKVVAESADQVSQHFGDIAACAPSPGKDPNYDDAAVKIGSDIASAAKCAASVLPSGAELCVRVVATFLAYDEDAYYAGAHSNPEIASDHPHLVARRAERAEQWKLLEEIFGDQVTFNHPSKIGFCIFSGAQTEFRLANGDFVLEAYVESFRQKGWIDEQMKYTDAFFQNNPELRKVIGEDGHVYFEQDD